MAEKTLVIFKKSIPIFNMLQDENRQQILLMLCKNDRMTVNQIAEKLSLSRPAVSHHLKLMLDAGILSVSQVGTERYYSSDLTGAVELLKELTRSLEDEMKK